MQKLILILYVLFTTLYLLGPFQQTVFAQTGNLDQAEQLRRDAENLSRISKADREEAKARYDRNHLTARDGSGDMSGLLIFGIPLLLIGLKFYNNSSDNFVSVILIGLGMFFCLMAFWPIALIGL